MSNRQTTSTLSPAEQHRLETIPTAQDRLNRIHQSVVILEGQVALLKRCGVEGRHSINADISDIAAAASAIVDKVYLELGWLHELSGKLTQISAPDADESDLIEKAGAR